MIDRKAGMERATGEDDARTSDVDHLRTVAAACAVLEGGAAVHRHLLTPSEQGAVSHEEVRLHPAVAPPRYPDRRGVPSTPGSKPGDRHVALWGRWCKARSHGHPFDHIAESLRPTATEDRDRALRAVVDRDENG
jgi:hypothetical protein